MEHPVTAVYDANILYPAPLRDLFMRLAQAGLLRRSDFTERWVPLFEPPLGDIQAEWLGHVVEGRHWHARMTRLRGYVELGTAIAANGGAFFQGVEFVTQYQGAPLPADRKSVSFRVTIGAADRTLSSGEITQSRAALIELLRNSGYELRV